MNLFWKVNGQHEFGQRSTAVGQTGNWPNRDNKEIKNRASQIYFLASDPGTKRALKQLYWACPVPTRGWCVRASSPNLAHKVPIRSSPRFFFFWDKEQSSLAARVNVPSPLVEREVGRPSSVSLLACALSLVLFIFYFHFSLCTSYFCLYFKYSKYMYS